MHRRNNYIHSQLANNSATSKKQEVPRIVYNYFKNIFGKKMVFRFWLEGERWRDDHELSYLERELSEEEIKKIVQDLGSDKAPEPDGFPFFFRQF